MSNNNQKFRENTDLNSTERLVVEKQWRDLFDPAIVKKAERPETTAKIRNYTKNWSSYSARYYPDQEELAQLNYHKKRNRYYGEDEYGLYMDRSGHVFYSVEIRYAPRNVSEFWEDSYFTCSCPDGRLGKRCVHEAALLKTIETKMGGKYMVTEDDYSYQRRMQKISFRKREKEEEEYRKQFDQKDVPALTFFHGRKDHSGLHIYDMRGALEIMTTDAYSMSRARDILKDDSCYDVTFHEEVDREGEHELQAVLQLKDIVTGRWYDAGGLILTGNELTVETADGYRNASQSEYSSEYDNIYDEDDFGDHEEWINTHLNINGLVVASLLWDHCDVLSRKQRDLTDQNAKKFFASFTRAEEISDQKAEVFEEPRQKMVNLYPRIITDDGDTQLSFRIEQYGKKRMVIKNLNALVAAATDRKVLELSKKESIDFDVVTFTDTSEPLYDFIARRIGEVHDANASFTNKNNYVTRVVRTLSVTSSLALKGALLDQFYDAWENHMAEYTDKVNDIRNLEVPVGYRPLRLDLKADKVTDARGVFAGVAVEGLIPVMMKGSGSHRYTLNARGLSRITEEEQEKLKPFSSIADLSGYFRFQVGLDNLQEFYYRIVPSFLDNPVIRFDDACEEEAQKHLPPEPSFDFWLDCEDSEDTDYLLSAKAEVSYQDTKDGPVRKYRITDHSSDGKYRDEAQEKRVDKMLDHFFPEHQKGYYSAEITDEQFFDFLTGGISVLEKYGTVHGTEAFRIHHVRQVPVVKLGVSVDSGIMDLTLTSQSLSSDELLDVLKSYHQRKRYHRLKSGDYLDLTEDHQLEEIQDMLAGLDISEEELVRKSVHLPLYRALYLEKLLEEHNEIVSSRDRVYRALIRNFATVKDAETEPPAGLESVLRPYQTYGFKWMKTLENAGFSGILADEMGLGKTLQMISVLLDDYQNHHTDKPSLIICPASLVYNWQEEFEKFAPEMTVMPVTGGAAFRKKVLEKKETQVYIISYDLLKRNLAEFRDRDFWFVVLDEAQYIKNVNAAVSKSVRVLKAEHRFALTGTPIENRLSELWSIFDFLMPGFLYSYREFEQRFDTPITKGKDETVAEKLKNMTSPFILRRKKEDVLQDLPEKLEEVRYVPISGKQQKLYDAEVLKLRGEIEDNDETGNKIEVFAELTKIREICCDPSLLFDDYDGESAKRSACMDLIHQAMDGGHRMLVFSQFTSMLALLEEDLKKEDIPYYLLTGSTSKEKRIQMVHAFNENDVPVFLISLKAGGTGLNLTGADVVIHYDPWWNLAAQNQATDRTHRIGQTKQVTEYKLIMKNTIEEKILDLQESKKDLAESVLSGAGQSITGMSKDELLALLD